MLPPVMTGLEILILLRPVRTLRWPLWWKWVEATVFDFIVCPYQRHRPHPLDHPRDEMMMVIWWMALLHLPLRLSYPLSSGQVDGENVDAQEQWTSFIYPLCIFFIRALQNHSSILPSKHFCRVIKAVVFARVAFFGKPRIKIIATFLYSKRAKTFSSCTLRWG